MLTLNTVPTRFSTFNLGILFISLTKVNIKFTTKTQRGVKCLKSAIETLERRQLNMFKVNNKDVVLPFLLLTLNFELSIVDFEHGSVYWVSFPAGFGRSSNALIVYLKMSSFIELTLKRANCGQGGNYVFKVNNRNTRTMREICSKLTIKIPERCQWRRSGIFIVNFEHISRLVLVFLLLTLNM